MRVIVTCGPSFEPIDQMRRITNHSTGELGLLLAAELSSAGHEVLCMKGEGAVCSLTPGEAKVIPFSTNADLLARLKVVASADVEAVFHVAALCDFEVSRVSTPEGSAIVANKIPTREGEVTLTLKPARKVLPELRGIFPNARIVGWKYELDGDRHSAVMAAKAQLTGVGSAACVVNGAAWGTGFGCVEPEKEPFSLAGKRELSVFLGRWLMAGQL